MTFTSQKTSIFLLLGITLFITSCSSDSGGTVAAPSYTGINTPAAITANNVEDIGLTSTEGTEEAVNNENASNGTPFSLAATTSGSSSTRLSEHVRDIVKQVLEQQQSLNLATGITLSAADLGPSYCGGSITVTDDFGSGAGTLNGSMIFNALCFDIGGGEQITMSGTITFSETATEISISYINLSVTFSDGSTELINMTITCSTSFASCSFSSDYVGTDGRTYRVSDFTVTGSDAAGYSVSGTFFHPDHGSVTFTTAPPITFNCLDGSPNAGTISFTGSGGSSATITFRNDCTGYDGTYNDGVSSGTFSGNWL